MPTGPEPPTTGTHPEFLHRRVETDNRGRSPRTPLTTGGSSQVTVSASEQDTPVGTLRPKDQSGLWSGCGGASGPSVLSRSKEEEINT